MSYIKELFLNHSLLDMNDEQTRENLANDQELRLKIADEIIEHIGHLENRSGKCLWDDFESYRGKSSLSELITKNAVGSFCDRNNYDWFELDNPYYRLFNFAMDYFITEQRIREHNFPAAKDIASLIRKEAVIVNERENITELDVFVDENVEPGTTFDRSYKLFIGKHYKENGIQNRVLFAISCLIMLSNMQEMLTFALEDKEKESKRELVQLRVRYLKSPRFDHRFYKSAIIIHFKNKKDFLNNGQFLYENGSEFSTGNELIDIVKNQMRYAGRKFGQFKFSLFKISKIFSEDSFFTCSINKQDLIKQLDLHFNRHFRCDGRADISGKEKSKVLFNLLSSADVECVEILYQKGWREII